MTDDYNNYDNNRPWSDKFLPQVIQVLSCGRASVNITPFIIDVKEAADLEIVADDDFGKAIRVAVRLRKSGYANKYPYDFTVRYKYENGVETEYAKIMSGYADIMFYGFVIRNDIARWIILDMDAFRKEAEEDYIVKPEKFNTDGRNSFLAFDIRSFKGDIVLGHSQGYFDQE